MKQLSSTSSSSSHLHRSTNVLKHPDRDEMGETIRNNSLRNSRKSSDVISDNESPLPPPPPSPPEHPCIVTEQMQSSSQSFGGSYVVTSPLSPLPPPPPPDSTQSGLLVFLPEKHSQNPLFADSEEEGKSKFINMFMIQTRGDLRKTYKFRADTVLSGIKGFTSQFSPRI